MEMKHRARRYKQSKSWHNVLPFLIQMLNQIWFSADKIMRFGMTQETEEGHYPEKDVDGKPKLYKVLPFV